MSWLGVTIESSQLKHRIKEISDLPAKVKWLSCEPLLDDLGILDLNGIDWVIAGGESGSHARAVGIKYPKTMPRAKSCFFLQTMGNLRK